MEAIQGKEKGKGKREKGKRLAKTRPARAVRSACGPSEGPEASGAQRRPRERAVSNEQGKRVCTGPGFGVALMIGALAGGTQGTQSGTQPLVVGYYADWTAGRYPLADIPADKLTHVNYAFGKIGADNRLVFNAAIATERVYPGDCAEAACPHGLFNQITLLKQKHPHLKFIISVGGWTDSGPFYEMAAAEETRQIVRAIVRRFPEDVSAVRWHRHRLGTSGRRRVAAGPARATRSNYVLLLAALRRAIGPGRLLTVAVPAEPARNRAARVRQMAPLLDWVSVMTYDFHSGGNTRRLQLGTLQSRRPVEPETQSARRRAGDPREEASRATSSSRVCRSTAAAGAAWNRPSPWSYRHRHAPGRRLHGHRPNLPEVRPASCATGTTWQRCRGSITRRRRSGSPTKIPQSMRHQRGVHRRPEAGAARCSGNCRTTTARCSTHCAPVWPAQRLASRNSRPAKVPFGDFGPNCQTLLPPV